MKKLWLSTLTAVTLLAGMSFGTAAWAHGRDGWGGRDNWHHDRYERCDDRDFGRHRGWQRPYREVRELYYAPAPRYYRPAPVYYRGYDRGYDRYDDGIRGSISVNF